MNHESNLYLGLDTSAYMTSLALIDQDENLVADRRLQLPVKMGSLGLRQSEAVFAHLNNIPRLLEDETNLFKGGALTAVAVAVMPRPVEGSYMPVFKVGEAFGLFLARTMGLKFLPSSHQEGHILAGLWSADLAQGRYLVIHLSGGTTEIIKSEEFAPGRIKTSLLGGSADLNAGQFIDRIGVAMGLNFPAGPNMELVARNCGESQIILPLAVRDSKISFSGPASHAERLLKAGAPAEYLVRAVENCVSDSISKAVDNLKLKTSEYDGMLLVGGVTANKHIRSRLQYNLDQWKLFYGKAEYAGDNAVGLAVQAARQSRRNL